MKTMNRRSNMTALLHSTSDSTRARMQYLHTSYYAVQLACYWGVQSHVYQSFTATGRNTVGLIFILFLGVSEINFCSLS